MGVYFENCKNVNYGFFGNLEVMSHEATNVLTKYLEDCHAVYAPCANDGCDWKYGAWGEDVFVQRCLDRHYVDKVEAFDMTLDGACAADRPEGQKKNKKWHAEDCSAVTTAAVHPFKTPKEYFGCSQLVARCQDTLATERITRWQCATRLARLARLGCVIPLTLILCLCRRSLTCPCIASLCTRRTLGARSTALSWTC